jgi:uncharacterized protein
MPTAAFAVETCARLWPYLARGKGRAKPMKSMNIAVVGAGVAGLSAAWLLSRQHAVTVYEREPRLGGHANTVDVATPSGSLPIDTGFIVYNTKCYPNLIAMFAHLGVATAASSMTFAVSLEGGGYEYAGSGPGLFGQASNLLRPDHWRMVRDIFRFFKEAKTMRPDGAEADISLGAWLKIHHYSDAFIDRHILPMAAAIWSAPKAEMLAYPAATFARFFANHGLLQVNDRPQWRTVEGGSRNYVGKLRSAFGGTVLPGSPVASIVRNAGGVTVTTRDGNSRNFDRCLIAAHADETLAMLGADATQPERRLLSAFRYQPNDAILHTDARHMPKRKSLWASWNYLGDHAPGDGGAPQQRLAVTYWMNSLQPLRTSTDYFVTLNPLSPIPADRILSRHTYHHPIYDRGAIAAQRDLWQIQGERHTWFAGSYFGYGFHEDALQSGLAAAEDLGHVRRPWSVLDESSRLHLRPTGASSRPMAEASP